VGFIFFAINLEQFHFSNCHRRRLEASSIALIVSQKKREKFTAFLLALPAFAKGYDGPAGISHIGHVGILQLPSFGRPKKIVLAVHFC